MSSIGTRIMDGLRNVVTGMGTSVDKSQHRFWQFVPMGYDQIEAAYRSSWLIRKIVELPAEDMTREWRVWEADSAEVERIEEIERDKRIHQEMLSALIYGRLGGGALFIGTTTDPESELGENEELVWVKALPKHVIQLGEFDWDPMSLNFGEPDAFRLTGTSSQTTFHPSRVIPFVGERHPALTQLNSAEVFWGDSVVEVVNRAVQDAAATTTGFSALADEARVDIFKLAGMAETLIQPDGDAKLQKRMETTTLGKSLHRSVFLDGDDDWQQRQINWAGMPDVIRVFLMIVAGAADVPATRLFGKAPDGQNSTGESDDRNYRSMIRTKQNRILRPALEKLDRVLRPTANMGKSSVWSFSPLTTPTEQEQADLDKKRADTAKAWADTGLIPEGPLALGVQSMLVEAGTYPALKDELAKLPEADLIPDPEDNQQDPSLLTQEGQPQLAAPVDPEEAREPDPLIDDAAPRTLYVSRPVENAADLIRWAKAQGFETTIPGNELHVTIAYSRKPVDWLKIGEPWNQDEDGRMIIPPGSARIVEPLGDGDAIVLLFNSSKLAWRQEEITRAGGSHEYPEYQPHITITYRKPADLDLAAVEPYRGPIRLGPERFAEVNDSWTRPEEV